MCHDIDKVEMLIQAHEYEKAQNVKLDDFLETTVGVVKSDFFKDIEAVVRQRRNGSA